MNITEKIEKYIGKAKDSNEFDEALNEGIVSKIKGFFKKPNTGLNPIADTPNWYMDFVGEVEKKVGANDSYFEPWEKLASFDFKTEDAARKAAPKIKQLMNKHGCEGVFLSVINAPNIYTILVAVTEEAAKLQRKVPKDRSIELK